MGRKSVPWPDKPIKYPPQVLTDKFLKQVSDMVVDHLWSDSYFHEKLQEIIIEHGQDQSAVPDQVVYCIRREFIKRR